MSLRVEFFFDIVSPYSYLAYEVFDRYRARWDLDVVLRPAFLGGVMKAVGNIPPASLPARAPYMVRDLGRKSRFYDVALTLPEDFPSNTLPAMRLLTAVDVATPARTAPLARALWRRHWGEGKEVHTADTLRAACVSAGVDVDVVDRIGDDAVKARLKGATDEAVARGAFGFPAFFVDKDGSDEMFFGSDRFDIFAAELGLAWSGPTPGPQP